MADLDPIRNNDPSGRWSRHSKTLALWVLIVLMAILAVQFVRGQENPSADFTYTEFRQQLAANNIHKVTVVDERKILGELRAPVSRNGHDMVQFQTTLPGSLSPDLEEKLLTQGVVVEGKRDEAGWGTIILNVAPWLLFLGFWIWVFRSMQSGGNRAF